MPAFWSFPAWNQHRSFYEFLPTWGLSFCIRLCKNVCRFLGPPQLAAINRTRVSSPDTAKKWLKSSEVRKLLNISPGKLLALRASRQLAYVRLGGVIYYDMNDIETMIQKAKMPTFTGSVWTVCIKIPDLDAMSLPSGNTWKFTFFNARRVSKRLVNFLPIIHGGIGALQVER